MAETPNLGVTELTEGQSQKEITINTGFEVFDKAIAGRLVKDVAGDTDVTLTEAEWHNSAFSFTGALTGDVAVIVPEGTRRFLVHNATTGSFNLTVRGATSTGVVVEPASRVWLEWDGAEVYSVSSATATPPDLSSKELVNTTLTTLIAFDLADNSAIAGLVRYAAFVTDAANAQQVEVGAVSYIATNQAGTVANNTVSAKALTQQAATAGTLTVTFTLTAASPALLQVTVTSSLTPATGYPRLTFQVENLTDQDFVLV